MTINASRSPLRAGQIRALVANPPSTQTWKPAALLASLIGWQGNL